MSFLRFGRQTWSGLLLSLVPVSTLYKHTSCMLDERIININAKTLFVPPGLFHHVEVCVSQYGTAVPPSWVAMVTPGLESCNVTTFPKIIWCAFLQLRVCKMAPTTTEEVNNGFYSYHSHVSNFRSHTIWMFFYDVFISLVVPRASCTDCELEEATSSKDMLDIFCKSNFGKFP